MDECPGCGYGDLDFSQGLFEHFAVSLGDRRDSREMLIGERDFGNLAV